MRDAADQPTNLRITVLSNPGVWREGDNPFLKLLFESYGDTVELDPFTWRKALGRRYDVLHVHWLEYLVRSENPMARPVKQVLFAVLLLRLAVFRTPSVWTVHNDTPHDASGSRVEHLLLAAWSRLVTHKVFLTRAAQTEAAQSAAGSPARSSVITHGHYRPVLVHGTPPPPVQPPAEILHFGHLRPYKGIEPLVDAYLGAWPDASDRPRLKIVGRAKDPAYGVALAGLVDGLPGVELTEAFLPDAELEAIIAHSDLVVLPYKKMNNSGAALLALSIGRPVLVPDGPTTRELQAEVGSDWVHLFSQPFDPADLSRVAASLASAPGGVPDLTDRDWPVIGAAYTQLFSSLAEPGRPRPGRAPRNERPTPMTTALLSVQDTTQEVLASLLTAGQPVALVDFPNHDNAGDSLILLGELAYLKRLGVSVKYLTDRNRYRADDLRALAPEGPILLHGGGNFGDRWVRFQTFRERVIQDFPDRPIIQLSQGIEFSDGPVLQQAQEVFSAHPDLTLLIRDTVGVENARRFFPDNRVLFCPDMAFGVGPLRPAGDPSYDIVLLQRDDSESTGARFQPPAGTTTLTIDWALRGAEKVAATVLRAPGLLARRLPATARPLHPLVNRSLVKLAELRVQSAVRILSEGKMVVTDRLHATVFSALMGRPVVAMPNANGKVAAIVSDYLGSLPGVHFAPTVAEAGSIAAEITESLRSAPEAPDIA